MSTTPTNSSSNEQPRDATYWAQQTSVFKVSHLPTGALALNVEGRQGLSRSNWIRTLLWTINALFLLTMAAMALLAVK